MAFEVTAAGMVTPVGFSAAASCAAMRVAIDGFRETRFMFDGDWLRGAPVTYAPVVDGRAKLLKMAREAVDDALAQAPREVVSGPDTMLLVCFPERGRVGRLAGLDEDFVAKLRGGVARGHRLLPRARMYETGVKGGLEGLGDAQRLLEGRQVGHCVLVGVDSFLRAETLEFFHERRRLLTAKNGDGFLPGEAAAAVLCSPATSSMGTLHCLGIGQGQEPAAIDTDKALRAEGLVQAFRGALKAAGCGFEQIDYRITDMTGEAYGFKDAALALARTMRVRKDEMDLWHPSECVGRVGAASVPLVLGVALAASKKQYAPGPGVLCHFSDDDGWRGAAVLRQKGGPSRPPLA